MSSRPLLGTDVIGLANVNKVGSTYIDNWVEPLGKPTNPKYIVVPIREPFDRWWSGYCHDMKWYISSIIEKNHHPISKVVRSLMDNWSENIEENLVNVLTNFNGNTSLESYPKEISFLNELVKKLHQHRYPKEILHFNTQLEIHWGDLSLSECWEMSNVIFIELKDLSNPKFYQWLVDTDSNWPMSVEDMSFEGKNKNTSITKKYLNWFWDKDRIETEDFKFYHYIHTDNKNNLMDKLLIDEHNKILEENERIYNMIKESESRMV